MRSAHLPARQGTAGFTLLEAIVALTIIAFALIPLVSFISQAASQLERAADSNERSIVAQSALAIMEPVNPLSEPEGQLAIDRDVSITWQSEAIVPPNDGPLLGAALGGFRLGFYRVHVTVSRRGVPDWFAFDLRKVGYAPFVSSFNPARNGQ